MVTYYKIISLLFAVVSMFFSLFGWLFWATKMMTFEMYFIISFSLAISTLIFFGLYIKSVINQYSNMLREKEKENGDCR